MLPREGISWYSPVDAAHAVTFLQGHLHHPSNAAWGEKSQNMRVLGGPTLMQADLHAPLWSQHPHSHQHHSKPELGNHQWDQTD